MAVYFRRQEGERIELSTPHIVIWTHGVGLGCDLVAGLETHPVLVSEVRGISEAQRAASGPLAMLVVLVGLSENDRRIDEVTKLSWRRGSSHHRLCRGDRGTGSPTHHPGTGDLGGAVA